jgi:hypothetical protein
MRTGDPYPWLYICIYIFGRGRADMSTSILRQHDDAATLGERIKVQIRHFLHNRIIVT